MKKFIQVFKHRDFQLALYLGNFEPLFNLTSVCDYLGLEQKDILRDETTRYFLSNLAKSTFIPYRIIKDNDPVINGTYVHHYIFSALTHNKENLSRYLPLLTYFLNITKELAQGVVIPFYVTEAVQFIASDEEARMVKELFESAYILRLKRYHFEQLKAMDYLQNPH